MPERGGEEELRTGEKRKEEKRKKKKRDVSVFT